MATSSPGTFASSDKRGAAGCPAKRWLQGRCRATRCPAGRAKRQRSARAARKTSASVAWTGGRQGGREAPDDSRWPGSGPAHGRRRPGGWRPPDRWPARRRRHAVAAMSAAALAVGNRRPDARGGQQALPGRRAWRIHRGWRCSRRTSRPRCVAGPAAPFGNADAGRRSGQRSASAPGSAGLQSDQRHPAGAGGPAVPATARVPAGQGDRRRCGRAGPDQQALVVRRRPGRPTRSGGSPGSDRGAGRRSSLGSRRPVATAFM